MECDSLVGILQMNSATTQQNLFPYSYEHYLSDSSAAAFKPATHTSCSLLSFIPSTFSSTSCDSLLSPIIPCSSNTCLSTSISSSSSLHQPQTTTATSVISKPIPSYAAQLSSSSSSSPHSHSQSQSQQYSSGVYCSAIPSSLPPLDSLNSMLVGMNETDFANLQLLLMQLVKSSNQQLTNEQSTFHSELLAAIEFVKLADKSTLSIHSIPHPHPQPQPQQLQSHPQPHQPHSQQSLPKHSHNERSTQLLSNQLTHLATSKETLNLCKAATAPISTLLTPEATPSPLYESNSPPQCSEEDASRSVKYKEEDDDESLYVDVESIDDRIGCKGQRKAHIDFYRKLKALRQRDKTLICQICHNKVENKEHSLRTHVHNHSETALYRCKLCGAESKEQNAMFAHIQQYHPNKGHEGFEDRRDMTSLSNILLRCFPKATAKTRIGYNEVMDRICKNIKDKSLNQVTCAMCMKVICAQKKLIARHVHAHPYFRCKRCKMTCAENIQIVEHCIKVHNVLDAKITHDFNVCSAAEVMLSVLKKCFPTLVLE